MCFISSIAFFRICEKQIMRGLAVKFLKDTIQIYATLLLNRKIIVLQRMYVYKKIKKKINIGTLTFRNITMQYD